MMKSSQLDLGSVRARGRACMGYTPWRGTGRKSLARATWPQKFRENIVRGDDGSLVFLFEILQNAESQHWAQLKPFNRKVEICFSGKRVTSNTKLPSSTPLKFNSSLWKIMVFSPRKTTFLLNSGPTSNFPHVQVFEGNNAFRSPPKNHHGSLFWDHDKSKPSSPLVAQVVMMDFWMSSGSRFHLNRLTRCQKNGENGQRGAFFGATPTKVLVYVFDV